jgi:hypothetical protein
MDYNVTISDLLVQYYVKFFESVFESFGKTRFPMQFQGAKN